MFLAGAAAAKCDISHIGTTSTVFRSASVDRGRFASRHRPQRPAETDIRYVRHISIG